MTRKTDDWKNLPGSSITCTRCGKLYLKSLNTQSIIICPKCGYPEFTYLKHNIRLQFPAVFLEGEGAMDNLEAAAEILKKIASAQICEFAPEEA